MEQGRRIETVGVGRILSTAEAATLPKVNALADSVERSARRVGELAESLERQPDSLLWGRNASRPGPGEEGFR